MGLFRLLWIPRGAEAARGAYVIYPARELLAILALESVRRRTLIIGEDLGTVPPRIRRELGKAGVFSYRVFYFERDGDGHFLPPEEYPPRAMATVTTHDLPTLTGFWQGRDLDLKRTLHLYPEARLAEADAAAREQDRRRPGGDPGAPGPAADGRLAIPRPAMPVPRSCGRRSWNTWPRARPPSWRSAWRRSSGSPEQQNLPGTRKEHPNWRLKLPLTLEEMEQEPGARPAGGPAE